MTGFYSALTQSDEILHKKTEEIYNQLVYDLCQGFEDTKIKPGFIGEIGIEWPIHGTYTVYIYLSTVNCFQYLFIII